MGDVGKIKSRSNDAKPGDAIVIREQELWDRVHPRYNAIMERHICLPVVVVPEDKECSSRPLTALDILRRKRLVYHLKQWGWLEVDLLLGAWALMNVHCLSAKELDQFEEFVNMETFDIYNVLILRSNVLEGMGSGGLGEGGVDGWGDGGGGNRRTLVERIQD
jgi:succinate dehydrogenase flavin-adding protein (antitoxin of CptAB toxin-antitoxin module)